MNQPTDDNDALLLALAKCLRPVAAECGSQHILGGSPPGGGQSIALADAHGWSECL